VDQPGFLEVINSVWSKNVKASNSASKVTAKLKELRRVLKKWAKGLSRLKEQIKTCNSILIVVGKLEENMPLYPPERNFRNILKGFIQKLLQHQREYWKKRYTIRWTKLGD
jgi:ABC-type Fe3+-citrate transport system substrate-binding protein